MTTRNFSQYQTFDTFDDDADDERFRQGRRSRWRDTDHQGASYHDAGPRGASRKGPGKQGASGPPEGGKQRAAGISSEYAELEGDGLTYPDMHLDFEDPAAPDEPGPGQRWSTWNDVERGQRGPHPRPDWVVESYGAWDTELGLLKTGKEADVFLIERAVPDDPAQRVVLAAKRYRDLDHRAFRRDRIYTEDRRVRRSRDQRALDNRSKYGRQVLSGEWAAAEFTALSAVWSAGVAVPYPVQVDGTEILMEFVGSSGPDGHVAAQRLAAMPRPSAPQLASWWEQARTAMGTLAQMGFAHGDLSPYNILVDGDRLVFIDLPQVVDFAVNPFGADLLFRDCKTMCTWFTARGLELDPEDLFGELVAQAW